MTTISQVFSTRILAFCVLNKDDTTDIRTCELYARVEHGVKLCYWLKIMFIAVVINNKIPNFITAYKFASTCTSSVGYK